MWQENAYLTRETPVHAQVATDGWAASTGS
jgi:hypothetical protein